MVGYHSQFTDCNVPYYTEKRLFQLFQLIFQLIKLVTPSRDGFIYVHINFIERRGGGYTNNILRVYSIIPTAIGPGDGYKTVTIQNQNAYPVSVGHRSAHMGTTAQKKNISIMSAI